MGNLRLKLSRIVNVLEFKFIIFIFTNQYSLDILQMQSQNHLHIYEEILLLALRDKKGTVFYDVHYPQALAAAILAELI